MRIKTILFLFAFYHIASGQTLTNVKAIQTTKDFSTVRDSIIKLTNPANTISIKTCEGFREFYLTKDSSHWTGYFIKNLIVEIAPLTTSYVVEGVTYYDRPIITTLISFNADSLYELLVNNKLYSITQLTEDSIGTKLNRSIEKKDKNIVYGLPFNSHDCNMTIIISGGTKNEVTYRNALIEGDDNKLHCIPTLKIFYDIQELLKKTFENYYH